MGHGGKSTTPQQGGAPNGDPDPYGRGHYDPLTGLSDYYEYPAGGSPSDGPSWLDVFEHWEHIENDLHQWYGIDVGDGILERRTYVWLMARVSGLLSVDSRLRRVLYPEDKKKATRARRR